MYGNREKTIAVIGAGPAGLFACERLLGKGFAVALYDRMPEAGRKLLAAGSHGGLNITNSADTAGFASRYGTNERRFSRYLEFFSPADLRSWLDGLGIRTASGSGGKIFPDGVDTPELLRRWMARLDGFAGFSFFPSHRLAGIGLNLDPVFETGNKTVEVAACATVLALGGASWPLTGSDGLWTEMLLDRAIRVEEFRSANCGYEASWDTFQAGKFLHVPLKNITLTVGDKTMRGELMLTPYGMEGGLVYALGSAIRDEIDRTGSCTVFIDLLPDRPAGNIRGRWADGPGKESLSNHFRKALGLGGIPFALIRGQASGGDLRDPDFALPLVKRLPVRLLRSRPLAEAISSAGGVSFAELDDSLMLSRLPGWFCAGEMLDWEAPTGGFLLQGCFSTAAFAAEGAASWAAARVR